MQRIVINACYGGFGISDAAYEKLIEWGVPRKIYRDDIDDEVIFDRDHPGATDIEKQTRRLTGRYWDTWIDKARSHPLLLRLIEELGGAADGRFANLKIVEVPNGVDWTIEEYDGFEHVAENHRTWH